MIEALFFNAYYCYLRGDLDNTKMYLSFMRSEAKGKPTLNKYYVSELKKMVEATKTGRVANNEWVSQDTQVPTQSDNVKIKQKELVKLIHTTAHSKLGEILVSDESFHLYNIEHPCKTYGRVDMLYRDSLCSYPLEVKKDKGEHDLIGQIMKYELSERFGLHLKFYYKVQPVTICNSYDPYTLKELKRLGVIAIKYKLSRNQVSLTKL